MSDACSGRHAVVRASADAGPAFGKSERARKTTGDHHEDPELGYATEELVAESVALCVCGFLGLDTHSNSIPYG